MLLEGRVVSGLHEAGDFINKEVYKSQYATKLGFIPYNGTLNIKLDKEVNLRINDNLSSHIKRIQGNDDYGDVLFIEATLIRSDNNQENKGAILFPEKTVHKTDIIEFVSKDKLREKLKLEDNTKVVLKI